jgi:hypothetical protein
MGFFSKTKISVASVAMPLAGEVTSGLSEAVTYATFRNTSISAALINESLSGMALRANSVYNYAKNHYTLGLPQGNIGNYKNISDLTLTNIIKAEFGDTQNLIVTSSFIAPLTVELLLIDFFINTRKFDETTQVILNPPSVTPIESTVYLEDIVLSADHATVNLTYYYTTIVNDFTLITKLYENYILPSSYSIGSTYCIAKYQKIDVLGVLDPTIYFWYYRLSDGTYPEISIQYTKIEENAAMPVIPLRYNNVDLTSESNMNTPLYITSKKLLKKMGIDIDYLGPKINENPDIAEIDHAYIMFGITLQTQNNESIRYLLEYFDYLSDKDENKFYDFTRAIQTRQPIVYDTYNFSPSDITEWLPDNNISLIEHGLNIRITYSSIRSTLVFGSIGEIGKATSTTTISSTSNSSSTFEWPYTESGTIDTSNITFRLQISKNVYKEVRVTGLMHTNNIYSGHAITTTLAESMDVDNNNFIIPIHYYAAKRLPVLKRNTMYKDSLILVMNSYVETKLKWYQTGIFKFVMIIIAVAIIIVSMGTQTGPVTTALAALLAGELTTAIALAALMAIIDSIIIGLIFKYTFEFVAKQLGAEWAMIMATVLAVVGFAYHFDMLGMNGKNFFTGMTTSQMMLAASSSLLNGANDLIRSALEAIQVEMAAFGDYVDLKMDELDKALELLDTRSSIDPLTMLNYTHTIGLPNESPTMFYNRTIHQGNIGVLVLDVIENYTNLMLKLPEPEYA